MRLVLALLVVGCGHAPPPNRVSPNDAIVYVKSNIRDAQVYLDGRLVGPIDQVRAGIALDPGRHRLEVRHDDYFSRYVELQLGRAERKKLEVELAPVLP